MTLDETVSSLLAAGDAGEINVAINRLRDVYDTESSASRQHYIETGRYLRVGGDDGPKVEILHVRDPDSSCGIELWLDGRQVNAYAEESIDVGRGWTREDWDEAIRDTREEHPEYTDEFRQAAIAAWEANSDSGFITT